MAKAQRIGIGDIHLAQDAIDDHFAHVRRGRKEHIAGGGRQLYASAVAGGQQLIGFGEGAGHRFLDVDVFAGLDRGQGGRVVSGDGRRDQHQVYFGAGQHGLNRGKEAGNVETCRGGGGTVLVGIHDGGQFQMHLRVGLGQVGQYAALRNTAAAHQGCL